MHRAEQSGSYDCKDCFNLDGREKNRWLHNDGGINFSIEQVFKLFITGTSCYSTAKISNKNELVSALFSSETWNECETDEYNPELPVWLVQYWFFLLQSVPADNNLPAHYLSALWLMMQE